MERRVPPGTWTPERVIAAIQDWEREFGEPPKSYEWSVSAARAIRREEGRVQRWMAEYPRWPGTTAVIVHFGSWSAALEAVGWREGRLAPWEMNLAERVEAAQRLDRAGLVVAEIAGLLDVGPATVRRYLRTSACPDCGGPVVTARSRRCQGCAAKRARRPAWTAEAAGLEVHKRRWERESIVAAFHAFAARHRRSPRLAELKENDQLPSRQTIERRFGSLEALRDELGLEAERRDVSEWLPPAHQRWDRDRIVAAIRAFADEHGRPPTSKDWRRAGEGHPGWWSVVRHFDSFSAALRAAGFAPRRISWGREEIIAALNAHLREHGVLPTAGEWKERDATGGRPALHNVNRQFGSWGKALEAAGHSVERWDRQTIIEALRTLGGELGRRPMYRDLCPKRPGLPCYDAVRRQFGSLTAALEAAGYEPAQWSREAIIAALRAWAAEHGRPPATADWKGVDSSGRRPATHHVQREFGTWVAALREADLV